MSTTVPRETLVAVAESFHQLRALEAKRAATQAELIRWCVKILRADPNTYRIRGHETYADKSRKIKENRENKKLALLYLEWLATGMEREGGVDLALPTVTINTP